MKRLIYITYLGLLALMLISCQKEEIAPNSAVAATPDAEARAGFCQSHFYLTKTGTFNLGTVRTDYLLVGFADNVTLAQQQNLLSQYSMFDQLEGDFYADSGLITIIKLDGTGTCGDVQRMLARLERSSLVKFATPVFNDPNGVLAWIGQTNEIMVTLKDASYYPQLQQLARITRTTIVDNLWDETYLLSVDKNSLGNALQITSVLNASPYVDFAEPNFLYQLQSLRSGEQPERKLSQSILLKQAAL